MIGSKIASGIAWEAFSKLFVQTFSWITTIYVARVLDPGDYGIVAISGIFVGFSLMLGGLGLCAGLVQKTSVSVQEMNGVFWLSLFLNLLVVLVIYLLAPYIAAIYDVDVLSDVIRTSSLIILISSLSIVPRANRLRDLDFKFTSLAALVSGFFTTSSAFYLAWSGYGLWALVVSTIIGEAVLTIIYLYKDNWRPAIHCSWSEVRPIIYFGTKLMLSRCVQFFSGRIGVLVSSSALGEVSTGYYQFSETMAKMPSDKIGGIFYSISFSAFSKIKDDVMHSKKILLSMHRYYTYIIFPALAGMAYLAEDLILLLLTEKWLPMKAAFQMLCIVTLMSSSLVLLTKYVEAKGLAGYLVRFQVMSIIAYGLAMAVGASFSLEMMIALYAVVFPIIYMFLLSKVLQLVELRYIDFFASFFSIPVMTICMIFIIYLAEMSLQISALYFRIAVLVSLGIFTYLVLSFIFMRQDLNSLVQLLKEKRVSA